MAEKRDPKRKVALYVGDKAIPLNPFTQDILADINIALVKSLKKVMETDNVQIKISIDPLS
ncbi:MAG: hypothetical protein HQ557_15770 [Bacteroidetes bacterium]|nr:hypothetical protein [Bacteroidota bacterium]